MARVQVVNQTPKEPVGDWQLRLQWCRYMYDDGNMEHGYRFIWVRPEGTLQAARGQARIPSRKVAEELFRQARADGWGDYDADDISNVQHVTAPTPTVVDGRQTSTVQHVTAPTPTVVGGRQ